MFNSSSSGPLGLARLRSDMANKIADEAKAWDDFEARYPNADLSKFRAEVSFDDKGKATVEVSLNRSDGVQTSVSGSGRRYWDDDMKKALGIPFNENAVCRFNKEIKRP